MSTHSPTSACCSPKCRLEAAHGCAETKRALNLHLSEHSAHPLIWPFASADHFFPALGPQSSARCRNPRIESLILRNSHASFRKSARRCPLSRSAASSQELNLQHSALSVSRDRLSDCTLWPFRTILAGCCSFSLSRFWMLAAIDALDGPMAVLHRHRD